jgi:hypothetical protein
MFVTTTGWVTIFLRPRKKDKFRISFDGNYKGILGSESRQEYLVHLGPPSLTIRRFGMRLRTLPWFNSLFDVIFVQEELNAQYFCKGLCGATPKRRSLA